MRGREESHAGAWLCGSFCPPSSPLGSGWSRFDLRCLSAIVANSDTLKPAQREAVEDLTRVLLNKFLHGPVRELKARAGAPGQHALAQLLGRIFGLGQQYGLVLQRQKGEYVFPEN